jgi:hypothetical protein
VEHEFQSLIKSHVHAEPLQAGELRGAFSLVGRILDKARSLKLELDDDGKKQLKAAALTVYDVVAKAVDIPLIPEAAEQTMEAWLRDVLSERLDMLLGLSTLSV